MSLPRTITAMLAVTYEVPQVIEVLFQGNTPEKDNLIRAITGLVEEDFPKSLGDVQYFDDGGNLIEKTAIELNLVGSMMDFEAFNDKFDKREELEAELRADMLADQIADAESKEDSE
jgi:hypothetical protein